MIAIYDNYLDDNKDLIDVISNISEGKKLKLGPDEVLVIKGKKEEAIDIDDLRDYLKKGWELHEATLTKNQQDMVKDVVDNDLDLEEFEKKYGKKDGKSVAFAVATKMVKKKEGITEEKWKDSPAKSVKVGDRVHAGIGAVRGAGFEGKVTKIIDKSSIEIITDEGKKKIAPMRNVSLLVKEDDLDEASILKPGTKVKVAHPAKGKGMVTGKIVRYDKGGPYSPFYVVDIGEYQSEKVPAHKIKEEVKEDDLDEGKIQTKIAKTKKGKITVTDHDSLEDAKKHLEDMKKKGWNGIISQDGKPITEEDDLDESYFKVTIPELPSFFLDAKSRGEVKSQLRDMMKPEAYKNLSIERATKSEMQKLYRQLAKEPQPDKSVEETVEVDETEKRDSKMKTHIMGDSHWEGTDELVQYLRNLTPGEISEEIKYDPYHKTYSAAVQHADKVAQKQGYEVDQDSWDSEITHGKGKPSAGKTIRHSIEITKGGKPQKKKLNIQVYGMDSGKYELNMYIEEVRTKEDSTELDEAHGKNIDHLRDIISGKTANTLKFSDGTMKVDLFSASGIVQVYDNVNKMNQDKLDKMVNGSKKDFIKAQEIAFKLINKSKK